MTDLLAECDIVQQECAVFEHNVTLFNRNVTDRLAECDIAQE